VLSSFYLGKPRNRTLADIVAASDAALCLAGVDALSGLLLLVRSEDRLAAGINREQIAVALFDLVSGAANFSTISRRLRHFAPFVSAMAAGKLASLPLWVLVFSNPVGAVIGTGALAVSGAALGYKIAKSVAGKL
jgi:hypothetical protein